jgi:cytochrome c peroxidase
MAMHRPTLIALASLLAAAACASTSDGTPSEIPVDAKTGLRASEMGPVPPLPEWLDNEPTPQKKVLGKALFMDARLSGTGKLACTNCHLSTMDFQDGTPLSLPDRSSPALGPTLPRHTPSLLNAVYAPMLRWDGSYFTDVFDMAVLPFAEANMNISHRIPRDEVETVDLTGAQDAMQHRLTVELPGYKSAFQEAFGQDIAQLPAADTWRLVGKAIAVYLRVAISRDAPFDRWNAGEAGAMSAGAVRGFTLFRGKALCTACHSGPLFSDFQFHNISTSLPGPDGTRPDEGRAKVTGEAKDRGAFLTPMLRSVGSTSPYLHDGTLTGIAQVVRAKIAKRGSTDPNHDPLMDRMPDLSDGEIDDLVQFLKALEGAPPAADDLAFPTSFP